MFLSNFPRFHRHFSGDRKVLWLRAISNVKVKLRHAMMPTSELVPGFELQHHLQHRFFWTNALLKWTKTLRDIAKRYLSYLIIVLPIGCAVYNFLEGNLNHLHFLHHCPEELRYYRGWTLELYWVIRVGVRFISSSMQNCNWLKLWSWCSKDRIGEIFYLVSAVFFIGSGCSASGIAVDEQISKLPQTKLPKDGPFFTRRAQSFWPVPGPSEVVCHMNHCILFGGDRNISSRDHCQRSHQIFG